MTLRVRIVVGLFLVLAVFHPLLKAQARDCPTGYSFQVANSGAVQVRNTSRQGQQSQDVSVHIQDLKGSSSSSLTVPNVPISTSWITFGVLNVVGNFTWQVIGNEFCQDSGSGQGPEPTQEVLPTNTATLEIIPTVTSTSTEAVLETNTMTPTNTSTLEVVLTNTETATPTAILMESPSPTVTLTATATQTITTTPTSTPTSTLQIIATNTQVVVVETEAVNTNTSTVTSSPTMTSSPTLTVTSTPTTTSSPVPTSTLWAATNTQTVVPTGEGNDLVNHEEPESNLDLVSLLFAWVFALTLVVGLLVLVVLLLVATR